MRIMALVLPVLALLGCMEPPKVNLCIGAVDDLQYIHQWDPQRGGLAPGDPYQMLISEDPNKSVPSLIRGLINVTPTKIEDGIHPVPTIGDVCFHALLAIFTMNAKEFEREGVHISKRETDPIYMIIIPTHEVRLRIQSKFTKLAQARGWTGE